MKSNRFFQQQFRERLVHRTNYRALQVILGDEHPTAARVTCASSLEEALRPSRSIQELLILPRHMVQSIHEIVGNILQKKRLDNHLALPLLRVLSPLGSEIEDAEDTVICIWRLDILFMWQLWHHRLDQLSLLLRGPSI